MDKEEALEALKKDQEERIEKCRIAIQEALKTYNCVLSASVLVTESGNIPRIAINPK
jgi:hypothetical protein